VDNAARRFPPPLSSSKKQPHTGKEDELSKGGVGSGRDELIKLQFARADQIVDKTAEKISAQFARMMDQAYPLEWVAYDYLVERLVCALISKNPGIMTWIDKQSGENTMRVAVALTDWLDHSEKR
jgi:hypothetical protein